MWCSMVEVSMNGLWMFSRIHSRHCLNRCSFVIGVFLYGASIPNDSLLVPHSLPSGTQTPPVSVGKSSKLDAAPSEIARVMATVGIKPLRMLMLIPGYLHLVASNAATGGAWVFIVRFGVIGPDVPTVLTSELFVPRANAQFPLQLWKLFLRWLLRLWCAVNVGLLNRLPLEWPHLTCSPSSSQRYSQAQPLGQTRFHLGCSRNCYHTRC